ncbi:hypothetical protein PGB90_003772 [Kerria lacca]
MIGAVHHVQNTEASTYLDDNTVLNFFAYGESTVSTASSLFVSGLCDPPTSRYTSHSCPKKSSPSSW